MANRKSKTSNPRTRWIIIGLLAATFLYFVLFGSHGLLTLIDKSAEKSRIQTEIEADSIKLKKLREMQDKLFTDDETIEKVAREKYNMKKPGETVYKVQRDSTDNK